MYIQYTRGTKMHKSERRNDDDDEYSGNLNEQIHYAPHESERSVF